MTKSKGLVQNRYRPGPERDGRLRVVGVSFLNAQPHLHGLLSGLGETRMQVELAEPAELARRLFEDEADVGLSPVAPLAAHGDLEIVPGVAIGCDGAVQSVCVVGDVPIEEAEEILLDAASRTSVVLTRLIARHLRPGMPEPKYCARPAREIVDTVRGKTLGLLIGDVALEAKHRFAYCLDLGQAWKDMTGLPFVFAVWAAAHARGLFALARVARRWPRGARRHRSGLDAWTRRRCRVASGVPDSQHSLCARRRGAGRFT
jgi:chorismate dehydratase